MSETFTKLFSSITESTVWSEPHSTRSVWVTLLAMADRDGCAYASIPGLARRANATMEETQAALDSFLAPDPHSRTKDFDGRRIVEIEGGWRLINHGKYRDMPHLDDRREYKRQWDRNNRAKHEPSESEEIRQNPTAKKDPIPYIEIAAAYNRTMHQLVKVRRINAKRKSMIRTAWMASKERRSLEFWTAYFAECQEDDFLNGTGPYSGAHRNWRPSFEYLIRDDVVTKTYERALDRLEREDA